MKAILYQLRDRYPPQELPAVIEVPLYGVEMIEKRSTLAPGQLEIVVRSSMGVEIYQRVIRIEVYP